MRIYIFDPLLHHTARRLSACLISLSIEMDWSYDGAIRRKRECLFDGVTEYSSGRWLSNASFLLRLLR
jgi:hypothetical protein